MSFHKSLICRQIWSRRDASPPAFLKFRSSTIFIVFTVCLAIFTDILFYGLIVPVLPFSLSEQIGIPQEKVQHWTAVLLACYNAALFVGSPIAGLYADHTSSRRWPFLLGLVALCTSTLLLCLSKTITLLVLGRLLQGLSAAIVWSVGLALLVDTVGNDIGYTMGYVNIAISVGLLISPAIGGAVYDVAGYYAVYYIAFAVICCDIALRLALIEKKVARKWFVEPEHNRSPNPADRDASTVDYCKDGEKQDEGGTSPTRNVTSQQGPASAPPRLSGKHPAFELVKSRRILVALLGIFLEASIVLAFDTVVPIYVKDTFGWSSTAAGLVFICVMIPGFASPIVGKLADRHGAKWFSVVGFASSVPALVCLRFVTNDTLGHKVLLCALLTVLGVTLITIANTPLMAEIGYAVEEREARQPGIWGEKGVHGIAYGLFTTCFALGGTVGSLMAGYINAGPGWGTTTWSLGVLAAFGAVMSFWLGPDPAAHPSSMERDQIHTPSGAV
ncbi:major facilitator superfamily domain-containing protein [Podospora fimiseda]|uniref:Major facilitator superfamily domain-containing protein n=1 Tax=Podospora fimiseda TaxID=252190 RepID=A0AAN7BKK9_9PEZI|nr:major facilitator superfamily domain-containing protein [Podospora fimiseda]